jgi:membrane protein YqaA with SNARE-associated domain
VVKRLYNWVLGWADTKYGTHALFLNSVAESSFFPIPPDVLLGALALGKPKRAFFYGAVCTAGSVIGGIIGYFIGLWFMDLVGTKILELYGLFEKYDQIGEYYQQYDAIAVIVAGITPIPYKVFTIAAGAFAINLPVFIIASVIGRGFRFFVVSSLFYFFGPKIKKFIDKYLNILAIVFTVLLIGGFFLVKYLLN